MDNSIVCNIYVRTTGIAYHVTIRRYDQMYVLRKFLAKYFQNQSQSSQFLKISWGGMPPDTLALACFACWLCFAQLCSLDTIFKAFHLKVLDLT